MFGKMIRIHYLYWTQHYSLRNFGPHKLRSESLLGENYESALGNELGEIANQEPGLSSSVNTHFHGYWVLKLGGSTPMVTLECGHDELRKRRGFLLADYKKNCNRLEWFLRRSKPLQPQEKFDCWDNRCRIWKIEGQIRYEKTKISNHQNQGYTCRVKARRNFPQFEKMS